MIEKDYITIAKDDKTFEQMEVVALFKLEESNRDCIIYKNLDDKNPKYYAASYGKGADYSHLNTDFTETEKNQLNKIFETMINKRDV